MGPRQWTFKPRPGSMTGMRTVSLLVSTLGCAPPQEPGSTTAHADADADADADVDTDADTDTDSGLDDVYGCGPPAPDDLDGQGVAPVEHVIDGEFSGGEWDSANPLQGRLTDLYLDFEAPYLYLLNDWRANTEGVRPDCFNLFVLWVEEREIEVRVFGSGEVTARLDGARADDLVTGAYGFGSSPGWSTPHTIYEFQLDTGIASGAVNVCCFDPTTESTCEILTEEPLVGTLFVGAGGGVEVGRDVPGDEYRPGSGELCGDGEGICADGSRCVEVDGVARCAQVDPSARCPAGTGDANGVCWVPASDCLEAHAGACAREGLVPTDASVPMDWSAAVLDDVSAALGCDSLGVASCCTSSMWIDEAGACFTGAWGPAFENSISQGCATGPQGLGRPVFTCTAP